LCTPQNRFDLGHADRVLKTHDGEIEKHRLLHVQSDPTLNL